MAKLIKGVALLALCTGYVAPTEGHLNGTEGTRNKRIFSLFNVVSFKNEGCASSSSASNGTCYTATECSTKGGSASGTCAEGFGVCCIFSLSCGGSSSENNTYVAKSSGASVSSPCTYTICSGSDICRIKLDFRTFDIASPQVGTTMTTTIANLVGNGVGDCTTDVFVVTAPGRQNPPAICGYNTGHHMIMDASSEDCITLQFDLGSASATREWDIVVYHYTCQEAHDLVGAAGSGCTEFITAGVIGTISNYNWPSTGITATTTHLSNQNYAICIRREVGYCGICYNPAILTAETSSSFGTSITSPSIAMPPAAAASATSCSTDYIVIPHGVPAPATSLTQGVSNRFCGRFLSAIEIMTPTPSLNNFRMVSVCSFVRPFTVQVVYDSDEIQAVGSPGTDAIATEMAVQPGGILGFKLQYIQTAC